MSWEWDRRLRKDSSSRKAQLRPPQTESKRDSTFNSNSEQQYPRSANSYIVLSRLEQAGNPDQNHGAHKCDNDRADHAAAGPDSQLSEYPAAQNPAEQSENDVYHYSVASTLHDLTSEPTCDQSDHNPCKKSHNYLLDVS